MEKARLLEDDEGQSPSKGAQVEEKSSPITLPRLCATLLLVSVCLNGVFAWLLARPGNNRQEASEHGQSLLCSWS